MELIELTSLHVAVPVIGVVICALVVFALGFRSPVQPPSFNFDREEDRRNKKRVKQTKPKSSSNGHVLPEPQTQLPGKASPKPEATKSSSTQKIKLGETKAITKKETKQDAKPEKKDKKKQAVMEEVPKGNVLSKKETEDDAGEWTTIQMSKKSKKQKPVVSTNKHKDGSLPESAVESVEEVVELPAAAAAASGDAVEENNTGSPQSAKVSKKKAKKEKVKNEDKEDIAVEEIEKVLEDKKKKNRKEKKISISNEAGAAAADATVALPQEAAPASAKSVKKAASPPEPEINAPVVQEEPFEAVKSSPKKKKGKAKDSTQVEKEVKMAQAAPKQEKPAPVKESKEKKKSDPKDKPASQEPVPPKANAGVAEEADDKKNAEAPAAAGAAVSFDEIGDSWQEAAPKSKKKKPRRDN